MRKQTVEQNGSAVNLYEIYKSIKQRAIPKRCNPIALGAAKAAAEAAKVFINKPSFAELSQFRAKEEIYRRLASSSAVSYADIFECALRNRNYVIDRGILKTHKLGWRPSRGTVYAFSCREHAGCIKIGATGSDEKKAKERIKNYCARYGYSNIEIIFIKECSQPALVESLSHENLKKFRHILNETKSNEWFRVSKDRTIAVISGNIKKHSRRNKWDQITEL